MRLGSVHHEMRGALNGPASIEVARIQGCITLIELYVTAIQLRRASQ